MKNPFQEIKEGMYNIIDISSFKIYPGLVGCARYDRLFYSIQNFFNNGNTRFDNGMPQWLDKNEE